MENTQVRSVKVQGDQEYVMTCDRIKFFRGKHPDWNIESEMLERTPEYALFKSTIHDEQGRKISTGHRQVFAAAFKDYLEKAETQAVGRALAKAGFGTESLADMDGVEIFCDAPVSRAPSGNGRQKVQKVSNTKFKPFEESEQKLLMDRMQFVLDSGTCWKPEMLESFMKQLGSSGSLSKRQMEIFAKMEKDLNKPVKYKDPTPPMRDQPPPPTDEDIPF